MNRVRLTMATATLLLFLYPLGGCGSSRENGSTVDKSEATSTREPSSTTVDSEPLLEDGVYPVLLPDEDAATLHGDARILELVNVPVEGIEENLDDVQVVDRPLLYFRDVPDFDFSFKEGECTEIGFANTEALKEYTRNNVGRKLAVVVNHRVISSHKIREPLEVPHIRITCCTEGGGDHLHKHLTGLKKSSQRNSNSDNVD